MSDKDDSRAENETLRVRLTGLREAGLRISEDLDLNTVLQGIVSSAQSLTDAQYGAITTIDDEGQLQDLLISGLAPEETRVLIEDLPGGQALFEYLTSFEEPFRTADLAAHARSVGFPDSYVAATFLGTRIRDRDRHIGNIYIGGKNGGLEFTGLISDGAQRRQSVESSGW